MSDRSSSNLPPGSGRQQATRPVPPPPPPPPASPTPAPQYGSGYGPYPTISKTNGLAIASLICSLFSLLFFPIFLPQVLGIVFGHISLSQIRVSQGREQGNGLAIAGLVIGYLVLVGTIFLYVAIVGTSSGTSSGF